MLKLLGKMFETQKEKEYRYLSESVDLFDLEKRMKEIERGKAPYQRQLNYSFF